LSFDRAIALRPDHAGAFNNRGSALVELQRPQDALASYNRAIALNPSDPEFFHNRANVLRDLDRPREALANYDHAIALNPRHADSYNNRGLVLSELRRLDEALASYDRAVALKPDYAVGFANRAAVLRVLNRSDDALASYEKAFELNPTLKYLEGARLHAKLQICDWSNYADDCAHLVSNVASGNPASVPFEFIAAVSSPTEALTCAKLFACDRYPASSTPLWNGEIYAHDRIRIAYLSADFHNHATACLMAGLFECHDRFRFETIAMSFGLEKDDPMRQRLKSSFDRYLDVSTLSEKAIAQKVRSLDVDIVVDLKGFTKNARTGIFAYRPAPIQVNYLGYPGTMGVDYIDYIIADKVVLPFDQKAFYREKIVHLPDCYQVNDSKRRIAAGTSTRAQAGLPESGFVFCCFNNGFKITPALFGIWMRLLKSVEGSVLWLLEDNRAARTNLCREAAAQGVDPARIVFAARIGTDDHLARHRLADLFLDTLPYGAHTTASDALWAGLPLLTCLGTTFPGRVGASLLQALGLPELIAESLADYERLALAFARDAPALAALKAKLARNRESEPLFDTKRFTHALEAAFAHMHDRHKNGLPPMHFAVPEG